MDSKNQKKWRSKRFPLITGFILVFLCASQASAAPLFSGASFGTIVSQASGQVVTVPNASTADGVALTQWTYWGGSDQKYQILPTSDGYFVIHRTQIAKCLAMNSAGAITTYSCDGTANEKWAFKPNADSSYKITTTDGKSCWTVGGTNSNLAGNLTSSHSERVVR